MDSLLSNLSNHSIKISPILKKMDSIKSNNSMASNISNSS
jgi:hypothetical protein